MADNVELNPGSGGAIAATDDVGGVHYQIVKLDIGGDGVSSPVVGALPVSAASLPLPTGAATDATAQAIQTLNDTMLYMLSAMLEKMPRVNGNDQAAVSVETGTVAIGSGTVTAVTTVGSVTNMVSVGGKQAAQMPDAISQLGALHLYQNITVS